MAVDLSRGACAGRADGSYGVADPFFPETRGRPTGDPYAEAREICDRCSIQDICLKDALTEPVQWGFRAGTTPEQRLGLVRNQPTTQGKLNNHVTRGVMVENGWSDTRIAEAQGVSPSSVRSWRLANGHGKRDRRMHTPEMVALKVQLWEAGHTDRFIAEQLGCRPDVIRKWRHKTGRKVNPERQRISA